MGPINALGSRNRAEPAREAQHRCRLARTVSDPSPSERRAPKPFVIATNGHLFVEFDRISGLTSMKMAAPSGYAVLCEPRHKPQ